MKLRFPDKIKLFCAIDRGIPLEVSEVMTYSDVSLSLRTENDRLSVSLLADTTPVFHVRLRWNFTDEEKRRDAVRVMGDTWERTYGELEWRSVVPQRFMPWYMLVSNGSDTSPDCSERYTEGFGVEVRPHAVCSWQYDPRGVTLWLDTRCGGDGVILGGRETELCRIVMQDYRAMSAYSAGRLFCREMCRDGLIPDRMIYGSNNWYYAVGNSSHEQILRDAKLIASLTEGCENRPYMVVDDGWQKYPCDGPWEHGNEKFPDMARLAHEMEAENVIPGIWVRYLRDSHMESLGEEFRIPSRPEILDPSCPEVIELVKQCTRRFVDWGYKLIKHDFTSFDIFGVYGGTRDTYFSENGWSFRDRSRTGAEITLDLYRAIKEAAGDGIIIIGCNTPSHLTAGLAHVYRTGNDTSGRHFERTRICGVNALSFRMMQNGIFYLCDPDCAIHAGRIDWKQNREWLRAVSESGQALFISADPDKMGEEQMRDMREALVRNSIGKDEMIPIDWMENTAPERYLVNGELHEFNWYAPDGTGRFIPPADPEY